MQRNNLARLHRIEDAEEQRRRLNRQMVAPSRHPDTGEHLPHAPNRFAAIKEAAVARRSQLMLPPLPPVYPRGSRKPVVPDAPWVRPLDLCLCGLSKAETAHVLGMTFWAVDDSLRRAFRALGVRDIVAAGAAWRARNGGHVMNRDDQAAARALHPQEERTEPLTKREQEAMSLLAAGVARRHLHIAMGCSSATVHSLLGDCYRRLGARNQLAAIQCYLRQYGGMDQAPTERPMAANQNEVRLEDGAKAGGPGAVSPEPGVELPP